MFLGSAQVTRVTALTGVRGTTTQSRATEQFFSALASILHAHSLLQTAIFLTSDSRRATPWTKDQLRASACDRRMTKRLMEAPRRQLLPRSPRTHQREFPPVREDIPNFPRPNIAYRDPTPSLTGHTFVSPS